MQVGENSPHKEAGLRLNSPVTGDVLFLVNSDAGEIVAFGGGAPFALFGSGSGNGYTPGETILMGISIAASGDGPGGAANLINYFIDRHDGMGIIESGYQAYSNLEFGSTNFTADSPLPGQPGSEQLVDRFHRRRLRRHHVLTRARTCFDGSGHDVAAGLPVIWPTNVTPRARINSDSFGLTSKFGVSPSRPWVLFIPAFMPVNRARRTCRTAANSSSGDC